MNEDTWDPTTWSDERRERFHAFETNRFRMKRDKLRAHENVDRNYRVMLKTEHWQGVYSLPRAVRRFLARRLAPLGLSRSPRLLMACATLMYVIGRWHTSPRNFDGRGCGIGPDGGFLLDRRGLSGPKRPPGCENLTEHLIREATAILLEIGLIVRITPKALIAVEDKNRRFGFWLKATKRNDGSIRAEPIRYKLGRTLQALFSKTLRRDPPQLQAQNGSPVGEYVHSFSISTEGTRTVGVSTGDGPRPLPDSQPMRSRAEIAAELAERARNRIPIPRFAFKPLRGQHT